MPTSNNLSLYSRPHWVLLLLTLLTSAGCIGQVDQQESPSTIPLPSIKKDTQKPPISWSFNKGEIKRTYYQNGALRTEGNYVLNQKEGLHKEWNQDGTLHTEERYREGKANGWTKWYDGKGRLLAEGNMVNGLRIGPWKICDLEEDGFCIEAYFEEGKREGTWKIYHKEALDKLWKEQTYKNDRLVAEQCWDVAGKKIVCEPY